jgi:hypothetical protein
VYIVRDKDIQNCTKSSSDNFFVVLIILIIFSARSGLLFDHVMSISLSLHLIQQGCRCKPTLTTFRHSLPLFFQTVCAYYVLIVDSTNCTQTSSQNLLLVSFLSYLWQVTALLLDGGKFLHLLLLLQKGCCSKLLLTNLHHLLHLNFHQTILTY